MSRQPDPEIERLKREVEELKRRLTLKQLGRERDDLKKRLGPKTTPPTTRSVRAHPLRLPLACLRWGLYLGITGLTLFYAQKIIADREGGSGVVPGPVPGVRVDDPGPTVPEMIKGVTDRSPTLTLPKPKPAPKPVRDELDPRWEYTEGQSIIAVGREPRPPRKPTAAPPPCVPEPEPVPELDDWMIDPGLAPEANPATHYTSMMRWLLTPSRMIAGAGEMLITRPGLVNAQPQNAAAMERVKKKREQRRLRLIAKRKDRIEAEIAEWDKIIRKAGDEIRAYGDPPPSFAEEKIWELEKAKERAVKAIRILNDELDQLPKPKR